MHAYSRSRQSNSEVVCDGDDVDENNGAQTSVEDLREKYEPPDGGWGWMVAGGCFIITTLTSMIGPCFGVLFSRFLLSLNTSSTTTAWIFNIFLCLWNGTGLFVRPLIAEIGWRPVAITGASINVIAFISTAFVPSAEFLYFTFSILSGIGGGSIGYICFTILPHFFYKHRGVANALMMAGICMGQFVGPPLLRYLQDEYGFFGSTLITGAIMLNAIAGAALFQPPEWHLKKVLVKDEECRENRRPSHIHRHLQVRRGLVKSQSGLSLGESMGAIEVELRDISLSFQRNDRVGSWRNTGNWSGRKRLQSSAGVEVNKELLGEETKTICNELEEKPSFSRSLPKERSNTRRIEDQDEPSFVNRLGNGVKQVIISVASDLSQLKSPVVFIVASGALCAVNGYLNFIMMVPFAMQEMGHSLQSSAWCISISAITNLVARIVSSALSDWKRFNVKFCYIFGVTLMALSQTVFPFFINDLQKLMIIMGLWGWGVGASMGVYNLVIISLVGVKKLGSVFGTSSFMVAIGFLVIGPIIGYIRDRSGSYSVSVWCLGGLTSFTLLLWTSLPVAIAHEIRMELNNEQSSKATRNS